MQDKKPTIKSEQIVVMNQHYKNYSLDYFLDCQERLEVRNVELWMSIPHFPLDSVTYGDCRSLNQKLRSRGLKIVCVTAPSCDFQYQYGSQKKEYHEKCIGYFSNGLRAAQELGAGMMTVNSGWGYWNETMEEGWKNSQEIMAVLSQEAEKRGLILVMETLTKDESRLVTNLDRLCRYLSEINSPALKAMVDTVAMKDADEGLEQWFRRLGQDIRYMHFIDGKESWNHYAWGDGNFDLEEMLSVINGNRYEGYLSQELITGEYLMDPFQADIKNMKVLSRYFE